MRFADTPTATSSLSSGISPSQTTTGSNTMTASPTMAPYKFLTSSIVVLRLGTGAPITIGTLGQPLFLDEYAVPAVGSNSSARATLIRSVPLPANAGNDSCTGTLSGSTFEGGGSNSFDGRFITLPCWVNSAYTNNGFSNSYTYRHIARIGANSDVKLLKFNDPGTGKLRGAVSLPVQCSAE